MPPDVPAAPETPPEAPPAEAAAAPAETPEAPPIDTMQTPPRKLKTPEDVDEVMAAWKDAATSAEMEPYRPSMLPSPSAWNVMRVMAEDLALAATLPETLRNKPADIALLLLVARDVGIKPTTAINRIHVIKGRPTMAAELMRGLVLDRGHDIWFEDITKTSVTVVAHRSEWPPERVTRITWDLDLAQAAGLITSWDPETGAVTPLSDKKVWRHYTRAMLKARATSEICRDVFPDILLGISYTPEELDVEVDADGEPVKVESSWSKAAADAPYVYVPAPQAVLDAFNAQVDGMSPAAKKALSAKWSELKLGRLKPVGPDSELPEGHWMRVMLATDEIDLADVAIQEVLRTVVEDAEVVHDSTTADTVDDAEVVDVDSTEAEPETGRAAEIRRLVDDLAPSQLLEFLAQFPDIPVPATEPEQRALVLKMIGERDRCETCGRIRAGLRMPTEGPCECKP